MGTEAGFGPSFAEAAGALTGFIIFAFSGFPFSGGTTDFVSGFWETLSLFRIGFCSASFPAAAFFSSGLFGLSFAICFFPPFSWHKKSLIFSGL
ncbi:hypothetical protein [Christensenella intestinihominis]|uniref:hypothetical protein n=1 Tax=Christensenella intestinihominis TaxID=1851429 RepID=UPI002F41550D